MNEFYIAQSNRGLTVQPERLQSSEYSHHLQMGKGHKGKSLTRSIGKILRSTRGKKRKTNQNKTKNTKQTQNQKPNKKTTISKTSTPKPNLKPN